MLDVNFANCDEATSEKIIINKMEKRMPTLLFGGNLNFYCLKTEWFSVLDRLLVKYNGKREAKTLYTNEGPWSINNVWMDDKLWRARRESMVHCWLTDGNSRPIRSGVCRQNKDTRRLYPSEKRRLSSKLKS